MKRNHWLVYFSAVVVIAATIVYGRVTASAQPGDAADPLVSKSYVDTQITLVKSLIPAAAQVGQADRDAVTAEVIAYIETVYGDLLRQASSQPATPEPVVTPAEPQSNEYLVVHAYKNQQLIGYSGTEIILRGGSAVAVTGVNGFCDVTGGVDVVNGANIKPNHLLIVPASDGRGMKFTSESYLMVKGGYYIVD